MGQFFKREREVNIHNLNENQLREAVEMYEAKIRRDIYKEVEDEYDIYLEGDGFESVRNLIDVFMSKAITEGMKMVEDTSIVTEYYKNQKNIDTRCGVIDKSDGSFNPCLLGEHWTTISKLIEYKHADLHDAFTELMYVQRGADEFEGVTREHLDNFIMTNFELVGERRKVDYYLEEGRTSW